MSIRTAAAKEEDAELNDLRDQADRAAAEAARTLAELARRVNAGRRPGAAARRLAAEARVTALRALRAGPGHIAGQRGARRQALAAIPVLALAAAFAYALARGKAGGEPVRVTARRRAGGSSRPWR